MTEPNFELFRGYSEGMIEFGKKIADAFWVKGMTPENFDHAWAEKMFSETYYLTFGKTYHMAAEEIGALVERALIWDEYEREYASVHDDPPAFPEFE